jgi:hypothetical protein
MSNHERPLDDMAGQPGVQEATVSNHELLYRLAEVTTRISSQNIAGTPIEGGVSMRSKSEQERVALTAHQRDGHLISVGRSFDGSAAESYPIPAFSNNPAVNQRTTVKVEGGLLKIQTVVRPNARTNPSLDMESMDIITSRNTESGVALMGRLDDTFDFTMGEPTLHRDSHLQIAETGEETRAKELHRESSESIMLAAELPAESLQALIAQLDDMSHMLDDPTAWIPMPPVRFRG